MADLTYVVGDTAPSVFGSLESTDPETGEVGPMDLTGCSVRFLMRQIGFGRFLVNGVAEVVGSETDGEVRYDWAAGDLSTVGEFETRWQITYPDGSVTHTEPQNTISVEQP